LQINCSPENEQFASGLFISLILRPILDCQSLPAKVCLSQLAGLAGFFVALMLHSSVGEKVQIKNAKSQRTRAADGLR
jgi:hypothetical protein